jgi:DNA-binding FadR family transcriptional regulator
MRSSGPPGAERGSERAGARNAHERTLDSLGAAIVSGAYPPGSVMPPEPGLCDALGVSRTVVREAVKSLAAKGLVRTGPKVGTRVLAADGWNGFDADVVHWQGRSGLRRDHLRDLQELRWLVEPAAARRAAERATPPQRSALAAAYAGMQAAIETGGDYASHDLAFHQGLFKASGNRMLVQMLPALAALWRTSFELSGRRGDGPARTLPLHKSVLDAVRAQAPLKAEQAMLKLIRAAQDEIDQLLATRRKLPSLQLPASRLKTPRAESPAGSNPPARGR